MHGRHFKAVESCVWLKNCKLKRKKKLYIIGVISSAVCLLNNKRLYSYKKYTDSKKTNKTFKKKNEKKY